MRRTTSVLAILAVSVTVWALPRATSAQDATQEPAINWQVGPGMGQLGEHAQIRIPEGFRFTGRDGVRTFMELTQNPVSGSELGVILPPEGADDSWFVVFEFRPVGYVKDDEKDKLDADAILDSIREGTKEANEERRERGWATMDIVGWHTSPRYDTITNNLTWGIRGASEGQEVVNYSVRLLGRRGVMNVDLVLDPTQVEATVPSFNELLTGFEFTSGNKYAEFRSGDKIAEYGLTALVAGGAGAALAKSGLLGKLWKAIVLGVIAIGTAMKKFFASLFGKKSEEQPQSTAS
jgi:uncharacterized membrane-anchored protein